MSDQTHHADKTDHGRGRVPTRVLLRGEPDGWHYTVVHKQGPERHVPLNGPGTRWQNPQRRHGHDDPEPPWWRPYLERTAESLRGQVERAVTDQVFAELGVDARIAWFAAEEPTGWEGLVTLTDPDPARFPGKVAPFVVTLEPGRGAVLPDDHLLFSTLAADAWTTLAAVSERCGTPPPTSSLLCGWADHRSVRVGRGFLDVSTQPSPDGTERIGGIHGSRGPGWGGNPELRIRLDGIDLLDEPAEDVVALLGELGHEVAARGPHTVTIPEMGLTLRRHPDTSAAGTDRFAAATLGVPAAIVSWYRHR
jgi:hypothetical protein